MVYGHFTTGMFKVVKKMDVPLQRFQEVNNGWLFSGKAHENETGQKTVYGRIARGISQIN